MVQNVREGERRKDLLTRAMGCSQKSFKLVWQYHQLLFGFLPKVHLSRVSRLSVNDKCDNEEEPGLFTDLMEFTLGLSKS
jgi:hypothetical protein